MTSVPVLIPEDEKLQSGSVENEEGDEDVGFFQADDGSQTHVVNDDELSMMRGMKHDTTDEKQMLEESYTDLDALSEIVPRLSASQMEEEVEHLTKHTNLLGGSASDDGSVNDEAWLVRPSDIVPGEENNLAAITAAAASPRRRQNSSDVISSSSEGSNDFGGDGKVAILDSDSVTSRSLSTASRNAKAATKGYYSADDDDDDALSIPGHGEPKKAISAKRGFAGDSSSSGGASSPRNVSPKAAQKTQEKKSVAMKSVVASVGGTTRSDTVAPLHVSAPSSAAGSRQSKQPPPYLHRYDFTEPSTVTDDQDPTPPKSPQPQTMMPMYLPTFKPATGCTNASDFVVRCFVARLRSGITVVKHGRSRWCKSRLRILHIHPDGRSLSWKPAMGEPTSAKRPPKLDLSTCIEVRHAWSPDPQSPLFTGTPILRQKCEASNAHKSFALVFGKRTVDLTAVTADQCKVLMEGFSALCFRLQVANLASSDNSVGAGDQESVLPLDSVVDGPLKIPPKQQEALEKTVSAASSNTIPNPAIAVTSPTQEQRKNGLRRFAK